MSTVPIDNDIDKGVDEDIYGYLTSEVRKSFFLFAGAGSGKTRTLVNVLGRIREEKKNEFRINRQQIAIITYTNAACDEIKHRLEFDSLFYVSTIHSFVWELIQGFDHDIREWLKIHLAAEISETEILQAKGRAGKTSDERAKKIERMKRRLANLESIHQFTYNPNGENQGRNSLNHSEVISIAAAFIQEKPTMQEILVGRFPILLIDESQDTKKELIDALFGLQTVHPKTFAMGLFGDTMQRIYADGKENLGRSLPPGWATPAKRMNHRCPRRVVRLINKIRSTVDGQEQFPRTNSKEGFVRLFIGRSEAGNKEAIEASVSSKMEVITDDPLWNPLQPQIDLLKQNIKTLTLEHHMAASRMGFIDLFEPLYKVGKYGTSLLDGTLPGLRFFTQLVLPIVEATRKQDKFGVARVVKEYSPLLEKSAFKKSEDQAALLQKANKGVAELQSLWGDGGSPTLITVLQVVAKNELFVVPDSLMPFAFPGINAAVAGVPDEGGAGENEGDEISVAWSEALACSFSQVERYNEYVSGKARFGTHQGIKGLEFPRVMVILDDEEAKGFMFSYEKLFGVKSLTKADIENAAANKDTGPDRTRRLFYVTCSRARESLAIVAYTEDPEKVKEFVVREGWFDSEEVVMM
jgi:DNA helicase II / ATP-dependent DNA helicase PcrA